MASITSHLRFSNRNCANELLSTPIIGFQDVNKKQSFEQAEKWSTKDSAHLYDLDEWGAAYFFINSKR